MAQTILENLEMIFQMDKVKNLSKMAAYTRANLKMVIFMDEGSIDSRINRLSMKDIGIKTK